MFIWLLFLQFSLILLLLPTFHEQMDSALSSLSRNYWHWQEIEAGALAGACGALFIEYRVGCLCRGQICGLNHPQRHKWQEPFCCGAICYLFILCLIYAQVSPLCLCFCPYIFVLLPLICRGPLTFHSKAFNFSAVVFFFSLQKHKDKVQTSFLWRLLGQNIERPPTTHKTITLVCSFISKWKLY